MNWWKSNENCKKCGSCADVCGVRAIVAEEDGPMSSPFGEKICNHCGACAAVCAPSAVVNQHLQLDDFVKIDTAIDCTEDQITQGILRRRSVRCYKDKALEPEKIERLLNIAAYAASGLNSQPLSWVVVNGAQKVRAISEVTIGWMKYMIENQPEQAEQIMLPLCVDAWESGRDRIAYNAPALLVNYCHTANPFAEAVSPNAITSMDIAAPSMGLGTCWAGYIMMAAKYWPPMKQALGLSDEVNVYGVSICGYPKYQYKLIPARKKTVVDYL